jgi:DNA repair exonuclease SbcCD ATPase subunit
VDECRICNPEGMASSAIAGSYSNSFLWRHGTILIPIFEPGLGDYKDHGLEKPVKFTEEFLKEIAATTGSVDVTDEHTKKVLSRVYNFVYKDGSLQVKPPKNLDLKDKGLSPVFDGLNLVEYDKYYLPISGYLKEVGLTATPRSHILYNSIEKPKEDDNLGDKSEVLEKALEKQQEQQEEIGILKSKLNSANKTVEEKQKLEKELKELEKEKKDNEKKIEDLEEKAKKYDKIEAKEKEELIKELAGEDEELKKELEDMPLEKLKFFKEHKIITQKPKGAAAGGAPGHDDDGTKPPGKEDPVKFSEIRKKKKRW